MHHNDFDNSNDESALEGPRPIVLIERVHKDLGQDVPDGALHSLPHNIPPMQSPDITNEKKEVKFEAEVHMNNPKTVLSKSNHSIKSNSSSVSSY